jgi:hypothetical protein
VDAAVNVVNRKADKIVQLRDIHGDLTINLPTGQRESDGDLEQERGLRQGGRRPHFDHIAVSNPSGLCWQLALRLPNSS